MRSHYITLFIGILVVVSMLLLYGISLIYHTWEHIIFDLSEEFETHLIILGFILIIYGSYLTLKEKIKT